MEDTNKRKAFLNDKQKKYYEKNKDKINEKQKEKIQCKDCGSIIARRNKSLHRKTQKHINSIKSGIKVKNEPKIESCERKSK